MFKNMESVSGSHLARALAIALVVANHSSYFALGGGMNFLLFLAGFNLAAFSFSKNTPEIIFDYFNMVKKILLPAFCIVVFYAFYFNHWAWEELLFISYIVNPKVENIALLDVWYCQVLLQMSLLLIIIFKVINVSHWLQRSPLITTFVFLLIAVMTCLIWGDAYPWHRWPHMYLWNFCLGWAVWAIMQSKTTASKRQASVLSLAVFSLVLYPSIATEPLTANRILIASSLILLFIWGDKIKLPVLISRCVNIVAKSTLFIFLLHRTFLSLYESHYSIDDGGKWDMVILFSLGLIGPCIVWLLVTSLLNTRTRYKLAYS